jgi:NAD(P)-dependent dehydrogenase (short-subunit alcohol dehydrogenase family)
MQTADSIKKLGRSLGADAVGIGNIERWEGAPTQMDPRYIMPQAKSCIVVAFRVLRGSLRGIEEGTFFSNYSSMGYGGITYLFMPMVVMNMCRQIEDEGYEALPIAVHTGSGEAIQSAVEQVTTRWGGIDILVNNAATNPHFGHILTAQESHWDKILDVNVKGYFRTVQACAPLMKERGGGKIINMASVAGKEPQPMMGVYSVSKAAVIMLTEVLAAELAQDNIQVNCIAPGFVKTSFSRALWQNEKIYDAVVKAIPQRRMADPAELTGAALYLASSASDFTTGATFVVDGGQLVGGSFSIF